MLYSVLTGTPAVGMREKIGHEPADLAAALLGKVKNLLELGLANVLHIEGDVRLGTQLPSGPLRPPEEIDEQRLGSAFESLGDIGHDGYRRSANLITQAEVVSERPLFRQ